jgi:hypothetical protein
METRIGVSDFFGPIPKKGKPASLETSLRPYSKSPIQAAKLEPLEWGWVKNT